MKAVSEEKSKEVVVNDLFQKRDLSDEQLQKIKNAIGITNVKIVNYKYKGKNVNIVWTNGVTPPEPKDFVKIDDTIVTKLLEGSNWYDSNKRRGKDERYKNIYDEILNGSSKEQPSDFILCSGAVAANQLHWWLKMNENYVNQYIAEDELNGVLTFRGKNLKTLEI